MTFHRPCARNVAKDWEITDFRSAFHSIAGDRVGEGWVSDGPCNIAAEGPMHALVARTSSQVRG